jgi:hypothetical protein
MALAKKNSSFDALNVVLNVLVTYCPTLGPPQHAWRGRILYS